MSLSNSQEKIERALYSTIRALVESEGYIPVIASYPNTQIGSDNYQAAVKTIAAGVKGFAIEVFGFSSSQAKAMLQVPRIVMKQKRMVEGGIGVPAGKSFVENGDAFDTFAYQGTTTDLHIDISICFNSQAQNRILNAIINKALSMRGYIYLLDGSGYFFYKYIGFDDSPNTIEGIDTHTYTYAITDLQLYKSTSLGSTPKITEITAEIYSGNYFPDGDFNEDDFEEPETLIIT